MKTLNITLACCCLAQLAAAKNMDLKQSKFTQVVNDVRIISTADSSAHAAAVEEIFAMPNVIRTGADSRAELVAEDRTITRVGANTVFSFDEANRTINLEKGSLLFNSPKGKGGGTIRTGAATAAVLGTTIIVSTTADGGFKVLVLEGRAEVRFLNGLRQRLTAGQMTFVQPGGAAGPVIFFRLDEQVGSSFLVNGFEHDLPTLDFIRLEIQKQVQMMQSGQAVDTGLVVAQNSTGVAGPATPPTVDPFNLPNSFTQNAAGSTGGGLVFTSVATAPATYAAGPQASAQADGLINATTLDASRIFTQYPVNVSDPNNPLIAQYLGPASFGGGGLVGYFANNTTVSTPTIDFTPYMNLPTFDFFSAGNLTFTPSLNGSSSLNLTSPNQNIEFGAIGSVFASPGYTINATTMRLFVGSIGATSLTDFNILNSGDIAVKSATSLTLSGNPVVGAGSSFMSAAGIIDIASAGQLTVSGQIFFNAQSTLAGNVFFDSTSGNGPGGPLTFIGNGSTGSSPIINAAGSLTMSSSGPLSLTGTFITSPLVNLTSDTSILVNNSAFPPTGPGSVLNMIVPSLNTAGLISMQNTDLSAFQAVGMAAHTVNLLNVNFASGSVVNLQSSLGQLAPNPNTGAASQPGYVNFINGVNYGGQPAQFALGRGINISVQP